MLVGIERISTEYDFIGLEVGGAAVRARAASKVR